MLYSIVIKVTSISKNKILIYILSGQDSFSLHRSLEEIKSEVGDQAALETNTSTLDGQKLTLEELRNVCETVPFLSEKRLVIVHGLLEKFGQKGRPRRRAIKKQANNQPDKHKEYGDYIGRVPETTLLVLIEDRLNSNNPLFKALSSKATVKTFPLFREPQVREWVQKRVSEEGGSISPRAVSLLTRLVGSNLWTMSSEISKLVLFVQDRRIEEEDIKIVVSYTRQVSVFNMIDAILEFRAELAEQLLQQLLQSGAAPTYLMTMLARQVQLIVRTKELKSQKLSNAAIQTKLGLNSEFVVRKTLEQASRFSLPRLREVYHHLLETDLSIKTGRYEAELALTILVAELCQRNKTPAIRHRY